MPLTLTVLRCPDAVPPETRVVSGGEFTVGRGPGVDWVLPDPERLLSKHHFAVAYRSGSWQIADTSTNGTTLNGDAEPIGRTEIRTLRDGDRLKLGAYEIEIGLTEEINQIAGSGSLPARSPYAAARSSHFDDPFAGDPFSPLPPPRMPFDEPLSSTPNRSQSVAQLPHDFDPLNPSAAEPHFLGPVQSDHRPIMEDAFAPPKITNGAGVASPEPGRPGLLPDDWDSEWLEGIGSTPPAAEPQGAAPPAERHAVSPNPFDEPTPDQPVARLGEVSPLSGKGATDVPRQPIRALALSDDIREQAASAASSKEEVAPNYPNSQFRSDVAEDQLLAAFLEGAGVPEANVAIPADLMRQLGLAFRSLVSGLRDVLIARASIKSEFRIEQTLIRARGNNPLKFSADDDDALAALLGLGRRTDMRPAAAIADALKDMKLHELASMSAMQSAVRSLLERLDPGTLRAQTDGGISLLGAQKKARAWDAFETLYQQTSQALNDDFDSVFGKAFARAYERAMEELGRRGRDLQ